ncbi:hypothetical protein FRC12_004520 [Ceratobasidium sp. 428]|nr:hypothetical protein FRC12_004520 [Ceratobasidium sp. 428]
MESNNSGKSDCQLDLLGAHELRESNLDVWSSDASLVFIPRLVCHEVEEVLAGETPETPRGCGGSARNSRSLTVHQPDLLEFLTADKQTQAEICQFACSQWFSSRPVLCWPEDPMSRLLASPVEADWAESGRLLFDRQLFIQAMLCFDKAGLPLERDVTAAYQARKEAWCLFSKSADEQTWCSLFIKAAEDFLDCAIRTEGKQQTDCYLRAAECFLQAKSWMLAANAFVSAEEYGLAVKCFCRAGCFDDAVTIVKQHKHRIQEKLADEVLEMARLEYLRQSQRSKEPFDDAGRQLAHMEDRARLIDPKYSDNMVEEVEFRDHDLLEYIRLLSASSENRMRQALTQTLRGLWMSLPFGSTRSRFDNPTVLALLEQLPRFDTKLMNDDERRHVALFQAIHAQDTDKLLLMAEEDVVASRLCEALLCFSHCARDLIPSQDVTISAFLSKSSLALTYYDKLATLAEDIRPSSVDIQRLLGFEPAQPDTNTGPNSIEDGSSVISKFRLFSTSPMFERAKSVIGNLEQTLCALELTAVTVSESDINRLANSTLLAVLKSEVRAMHAVASIARCIQPCLGLAVFGVCKLENCGRLEVDTYQTPNNTRQSQFHEVLRAHLLQILIIDSCPETTPEERRWYDGCVIVITDTNTGLRI